MAALPDDDLRALVARVRAGDDAAWTTFVWQFAPLLLQVARMVERDADAAADAFVYTCQQLRDRRAARLGAFAFDRPGSFDTWLRAVALNLCRDARRRRLGRFRPFAALQRLPPLEQRLFRLRHELGFTFDQAFQSLVPEFPGLTEAQLAAADESVSVRLSTRQRWALLTRRPRLESVDGAADDSPSEIAAPPEQADPEWQLLMRESAGRLTAALATLSADERLLVRLRFERGVTLKRLATMFGYRDLQTADRRIRDVLTRLRAALRGPS